MGDSSPYGGRYFKTIPGILFFIVCILTLVELIVLAVWMGEQEKWPKRWELSFSAIITLNIFGQLINFFCTVYFYDPDKTGCCRPKNVKQMYGSLIGICGIQAVLYLISGCALAYRADEWNETDVTCTLSDCKHVAAASAISFFIFADLVAIIGFNVKLCKEA